MAEIRASIKTNPNLKTTVAGQLHLGKGRVVGIRGATGVGIKGETGEVGMSWRGEYNGTFEYKLNDVVSLLGSSYIYILETPATGVTPTSVSHWEVVVERGGIGVANEDKHFTHIQNVASASWIIPHNLNKYPSVTVIDSGGTNVEGHIEYLDVNTIELIFSAPFTGTAYLN